MRIIIYAENYAHHVEEMQINTKEGDIHNIINIRTEDRARVCNPN